MKTTSAPCDVKGAGARTADIAHMRFWDQTTHGAKNTIYLWQPKQQHNLVAVINSNARFITVYYHNHDVNEKK
jgi:hypothetical protein